ncbi:MAG: hypothetical protein GX187_08640 [Clostridiaceae bacterium]|nr:hypothetical protein [Clostridiaceae bacterium]
MKKYHFTTVVSQDHFFKFMALVSSLRHVSSNFTLFVLCAHDIVYHILNKIKVQDVVPVKLSDVESDELRRIKRQRHFHAYCWTLKPVFLCYVMERYPDCEYFAHLDADLFFFDTPDNIFNESPNSSLYLTHHRNSKDFLQYYKVTGIFNTGFVGCKNDETAFKAIEKWKYQCIEYCPIKEDRIRRLFGDQRYVESWPNEYEGVYVVQSYGANTAVWNIQNYEVSVRDNKVYINEYPLTFYHFSGLTLISRNEFNLNWYYKIEDERVMNYIYKPYIITLVNIMKEMEKHFPWFNAGFLSREYTPDTHYYKMEDK